MSELMRQELNRLVQMLPVTDPSKSEYHILLRSIECLEALGQTIEEILAQVFDDQDTGAIELKPIPFPKPDLDPTNPVPVPKPIEPPLEPANKSVTESADSPAVTEKTYSSAEIRAALVDARTNRGIDIKQLLAKFGAANYQEVPAAKYGELMKMLEVVE